MVVSQATSNSGLGEAGRGAGLASSPRALGSTTPNGDPVAIVDAAVRVVLAEFQGSRRPTARGSPPVFAGRLLSLRSAEALAPDARAVRIAPGAVVTPLARDLLKRRGVAIQCAGFAEFGSTTAGEWAFAIDSDLGSLQALRRSLLEDGGRWIELGPSLVEAVDWLRESDARGVLLATDDGALAVWRACQVEGVRAAAASEPTDVDRASRSMGANLIVVEPAGKSPSWLKQIASAFRRAGAPAWPREAE